MGYRLDQHTSDREAQLSPKTGLLYTPLSSCHSTQRILMEHKQPSESQRIRERRKQTLKAGHTKKIHIHNMEGRVADLSAMMKITRPCGKCWDVTCLLYVTVFFPLLIYRLDSFSVSLSCLISLSISLTTIACVQR